jgi:hypothetical protein
VEVAGELAESEGEGVSCVLCAGLGFGVRQKDLVRDGRISKCVRSRSGDGGINKNTLGGHKVPVRYSEHVRCSLVLFWLEYYHYVKRVIPGGKDKINQTCPPAKRLIIKSRLASGAEEQTS